MKKFLIVIICTFLALSAAAQDPLADRFMFYSKLKGLNNLFVHFDKNVYSSNETVWFTGYVISSSNVKQHKLMSVSLISNDNNKIMLEDRFTMENGLSYGNLIIPDSIAPGQYRLVAITDYLINNKPELMFTQPISIKSNLEPPFKASIKILEQNANHTKVLINATTADNRFLPKPLDIHYKYGATSNTIKTDNSGQAIISLPANTSLNDPNIYVKLKNEKDSTNLNIPIPQQKAAPQVKFYPEGGDIVAGLINNIGIEIKNLQHQPQATKGYLLKNNTIVDSTITTNAHGLGNFKLFAEEGANYTFKLKGKNFKDTTFTLPKIKEDGLTINVTNAVVTDTLRLNIRAKVAQTIGVRVHNYKESILYAQINIKAGVNTFKLPLAEVPKGLATLTITDNEERPLAERIIFAHYDKAEKFNIVVNKPTYGPREKVNLKLGLLDGGDKGFVSVAVVQDNRIENKNLIDIESYTFLSNQLSHIPKINNGQLIKHQELLEQILLVKGWRRYTWKDLVNTTANDTASTKVNLKLLGKLTKSNRPVNKSINIGAMGTIGIRLVSTNNSGEFDFDNPQLFSEVGKNLFFFIDKKDDQSLKFRFDNQLLNTQKGLALNPNSFVKDLPEKLDNNADMFVKANEKSIRLQEVTISGKAGSKILKGKNACGDFVCRFNVFNCRNHYGDPSNTQPIAGKFYRIDGVNKPYPGCNITDESIYTKADGIHIHRDFYIDSFKDPQEPAYFSTIYWNYRLPVAKGREASINFYTSDITGKYRVIVQGITDSQVVYGEKYFEVKRK